jgi:hypothetical protein
MFDKVTRRKKVVGSLLLASSLSGCGLVGSDGPVRTDKAFYQEIAAGNDHQALQKYYLGKTPSGPNQKANIEETDDKMRMILVSVRHHIHEHGGLKDIKLLHREVKGNTATVTLQFDYGDGQHSVNTDHLTRINGKWLVNAG